jgi:hypothetical protein
VDNQLLFYKRIVSLNPAAHGRLHIAPSEDVGYARVSNSVPLIGPEFSEAGKEYPIAFAKAGDGQFVPVAVLGLNDGENLFVNGACRWIGHYIPAFVRRYPFVPAEQAEDKQLVVCFDETSPRFNETAGEPLLVDGEPSAYLQQIIGFLREFHAESQRTAQFAATLHELDLLTERRADAVSPSGERYSLSGLWIVDEARFQKISRDALDSLFQTGALGLIYLHLASLSNFARLLERKAAASTEKPH